MSLQGNVILAVQEPATVEPALRHPGEDQGQQQVRMALRRAGVHKTYYVLL
jgi:hypothetical protein